jgi:uncharacterized membrane protein (DUF4010 family)
MMDSVWFDFAVAIALGLLIGLERERSKGKGSSRRPAGIRTFALASLLGALAIHVGGIALLATAVAIIGLLAGLAYFRSHDDDPGLTTDIGLLIAPLLGGLAMSDSGLASGLGAAVAVIFAAKAALHGFVKGSLTGEELNDGLVFAIVTLIVWPLLPDRYLGPLQALNPHTLWLLVVLVLAIGACGHVATRALGARYGLPIAGLASGFVSSTATIGSMAGLAVKEPTSMKATVAGATLSTVATFVQLALLLFAIGPPTLKVMAPALAAGGITAGVYGLLFTALAFKSTDAPQTESGGRAFSIKTALALSATMAVMLVAAAVLKEWLGEAGIVVGAAVAGLIDAHSAAISVASLATSGKLTPQDAVLPILAGMTSNAAAKGIMAIGAGSWSFALRIVPGLLLSLAAAWIAAFVTGLR